MGVLGGGRVKGYVEATHKWSYLPLADFEASSWFIYVSYTYLWFLVIVAIGASCSDTFTAVNLLAYDKWSSHITPAIPLQYAKWIFAACIIASWLLSSWEWFRAIRVIFSGSVAESYLDPLAVKVQSTRPFGGWKRFLVFGELTQSTRGFDYIALFVYFQLQDALRIIVAEAPRQVVNGVTLWSVLKSDIVTDNDRITDNGISTIERFFGNIEALAAVNREQALVILTMLFSFLVFLLAAFTLISAILCYILFLWLRIPKKDGTLNAYCRRKINDRVSKIVSKVVKQSAEMREKRLTEEREKAAAKVMAKAVKKADKLHAKEEKEYNKAVEYEEKKQKQKEEEAIKKRQDYIKQIQKRDKEESKEGAAAAKKEVEQRLALENEEKRRLKQEENAYARSVNDGEKHYAKSLRENTKEEEKAAVRSIKEGGPRPAMHATPHARMLARSNTVGSAYSNINYEHESSLLENATAMGYAEDPYGYGVYRGPGLHRQLSDASSYRSRPSLDRQPSNASYTPYGSYPARYPPPMRSLGPLSEIPIGAYPYGGPEMFGMAARPPIAMYQDPEHDGYIDYEYVIPQYPPYMSYRYMPQ